jgi:hypothetical protein
MATWSKQLPEADPRDNCPCGSGYPIGVCASEGRPAAPSAPLPVPHREGTRERAWLRHRDLRDAGRGGGLGLSGVVAGGWSGRVRIFGRVIV